MWDVKLRSGYSLAVSLWFYLNYVGCKVFLFYVLPSRLEGFTLTMWDVKPDPYPSEEEEEKSFTLTMWDVKNGAEAQTRSERTVLP